MFFYKNWYFICEVGLCRGVYYFFCFCIDVCFQVLYFIDQVILRDGDLFFVLDIEVFDKVDFCILVIDLYIWFQYIYEYYGVKLVFYINFKFYNCYLAGYFDDYFLWIVCYSEEEFVLVCGCDWQFWQYGNWGKFFGIDGYVDFNVFFGDWFEFDSFVYSYNIVLSNIFY